MVSKNQTKLIINLQQKKYRNKHNLFIAEGIKVVEEFLNAELQVHEIYCTDPLLFQNKNIDSQLITEKELKKISSLSTPNKVLAIFKKPNTQKIDTKGLILALDNLRDPGNLGTIIRLCDWFGIKDLVCNKETVDCFNTKVVQATMGSLARINITYTDLSGFLSKHRELISYATTMNGDSIYKSTLSNVGIVIMGNESNGISREIEAICTSKITIPRFGELQKTESLNVATATAIVLNEFKRGIV